MSPVGEPPIPSFHVDTGMNKDPPSGKASALYSELSTARESATATCVFWKTLKGRHRSEEPSGGKREGSTFALTVGPRGLYVATGQGSVLCASLGVLCWLSLGGPELEAGTEIRDELQVLH